MPYTQQQAEEFYQLHILIADQIDMLADIAANGSKDMPMDQLRAHIKICNDRAQRWINDPAARANAYNALQTLYGRIFSELPEKLDSGVSAGQQQ